MKIKTILLIAVLLLTTTLPALSEDDVPVPAVFADNEQGHFLAEGETPVIGEMSYHSSNLSIDIRLEREYRSDIYVADVWVRDLSLLRRGFGGGRYRSKMQKVATIATNEGAILALTGDNGHNFGKGIVFTNGELKRKKLNNKRDVCIIYMDGKMEVIKGADLTSDRLKELTGNVWQSFLFGPGLLDQEGHALEKFSTNDVSPANPRAVIGYFEPGHYCLVQVDGRGTSSAISGKNVGMKMTELAAYMESIGCKAAYNLDGGRSALMWFNGKVISNPYRGGRSIGDIVYFTDNTAFK